MPDHLELSHNSCWFWDVPDPHGHCTVPLSGQETYCLQYFPKNVPASALPVTFLDAQICQIVETFETSPYKESQEWKVRPKMAGLSCGAGTGKAGCREQSKMHPSPQTHTGILSIKLLLFVSLLSGVIVMNVRPRIRRRRRGRISST